MSNVVQWKFLWQKIDYKRESDWLSYIKPKDGKLVKIENIDWIRANLCISYKSLDDEYEVTTEYTIMEYEYEWWTKLYRRYYEDYSNDTDIFYAEPECWTVIATRALSI